MFLRYSTNNIAGSCSMIYIYIYIYINKYCLYLQSGGQKLCLVWGRRDFDLFCRTQFLDYSHSTVGINCWFFQIFWKFLRFSENFSNFSDFLKISQIFWKFLRFSGNFSDFLKISQIFWKFLRFDAKFKGDYVWVS